MTLTIIIYYNSIYICIRKYRFERILKNKLIQILCLTNIKVLISLGSQIQVSKVNAPVFETTGIIYGCKRQTAKMNKIIKSY